MKVSYQDLLKFIIPSSIGVLLFLTPIFIDGRATIGMGILVDLLRDATQDYLPAFATMLLLVSCLCSTYFSLFRKNKSNKPINQIQQIFTTSPAWLILRILGSLFAVLVLFNIGPEWISSPATGGTMLFQLAGTLTVFFLVACFFCPFSLIMGWQNLWEPYCKNRSCGHSDSLDEPASTPWHPGLEALLLGC